ncbi:hypothetical protein FRC01_004190 [Tulasnella sp. 417]|nr:hypothetical protein FRC01_004190 [Tulasnella sp. 417]
MASSDKPENVLSDTHEPIPSLIDSLLALRPQSGHEELGWDDFRPRPNNMPPGDDSSDSGSLDSLILSTPVKGSPATKKAIRKKKGQAKAQLTKKSIREQRAAEADATAKRAQEQERERIEEEMLREQEDEERRMAKEQEAWQHAIVERQRELKALANNFTSALTLGDFLSWVFPGEATEVSELESVKEDLGGVGADWRWTQFFRGGNLQHLLNFWSSSQSPPTARKLVDEFAVQRVMDMVRMEAKAVTESKLLWSQRATVNEDFVLGFNYEGVHKRLTEELAPISMRLVRQIATSKRQEKDGITAQRAERKLYGCSNDLTSAHCEPHTATNSNGESSAPTEQGTLLADSNLTQPPLAPVTENNLQAPALKPQPTSGTNDEASGLIRKLSQFCRLAARRVARTLLYLTLYDNVNISDKVAEQVMGRKDTQINGTCATIVELHNASPDSLLSSSVDEAFTTAKPLAFGDIAFTEAERKLWDRLVLNTFLRIATTYGGPGFERFQREVEIDTPVSDSKIALHKTEIYPLPAFEIDESSITGNIEVLEAISEELKLDTTSPDFMRHVRLFAGDQLSISRLRSIAKYRAGHEGGFQSFRWPITIPGLFHLKMAATQGVLETFFGKPNSSHRNPGSLHHHNLVLDRKPIVLTSLPPFRTTRDLIFHSLYARVLHCILLVSDQHTLKDLGHNLESYAALKTFGIEALGQYASTSKVAEMRNQRNASKLNASTQPGGDMVLESGILFLRDALALRALTDVVKSGDSGLVLLALKNLAFAFRANGRTKKLVLDNWLVNTTGRGNAWVELDLLQEHLNFWIKVVYKAHGSNASWEWLATISPCIDILRKLATQMHLTLGTRQGSRHQTPGIARDLHVLMEDLAVRKVYVYEAGREFDEDDPPPKDVITEGAIALINGGDSSPLAQYNAAFNTLRKRMAVPVIVGSSIPSRSEGTRAAQAATAGAELANVLPGGDGQNELDGSSGVRVVRDTGESGSEASGEAESASEGESDCSDPEEDSILGEETLVEMAGDLDVPDRELALEGVGDVALEMDAEEAWEDDGDENDDFFDV